MSLEFRCSCIGAREIVLIHTGNMTTVNSEQNVKEGGPVASISSEQTLSTLRGESPLAGICNVETKASQAPINSTAAAQLVRDEKMTNLKGSIGSTAGAQFPVREEKMATLQASICSTVKAQFPVREEEMTTLQASISSTAGAQFLVRKEKMTTLQASFAVWEEKERTSDRFVSLWSEAVERLCNICRMDLNSRAEATQLTGREERRRTSEQAGALLEVAENFIGGLENLCLLENRHGVSNRRSPLPSWYPRRPLQDITEILNIGPVPPEEASNLKKGSKKAQTVQLYRHLHDNRGPFGQQRAPRVPFKPSSPVPAAPKRSSLLRKGFR